MKIQLKPRTAEHVKVYWERTQDTEIRSLIPIGSLSLEESLRQFEEAQRPGASSFGRSVSVDDTYVGDVWCYGIDEQDEKMAMFSFLIFEKSLWGKGVGSAAARLFLAEAFSRYAIEKMGAFTYADNFASLGALKKAGFQEAERFEEDGRLSVYLEAPRKILAACGNDCAQCPRHLPRTEEELRETAELWRRIGYRDHVVSPEEISCAGCSSHNWCRYEIVKCAEKKGGSTCGSCPEYPCARIVECFQVTESFAPQCKACCTPEQYDALASAFFEKKRNLDAASGEIVK